MWDDEELFGHRFLLFLFISDKMFKVHLDSFRDIQSPYYWIIDRRTKIHRNTLLDVNPFFRFSSPLITVWLNRERLVLNFYNSIPCHSFSLSVRVSFVEPVCSFSHCLSSDSCCLIVFYSSNNKKKSYTAICQCVSFTDLRSTEMEFVLVYLQVIRSAIRISIDGTKENALWKVWHSHVDVGGRWKTFFRPSVV